MVGATALYLSYAVVFVVVVHGAFGRHPLYDLDTASSDATVALCSFRVSVHFTREVRIPGWRG